MIRKFLIILFSTTLIQADNLGTDYAPATSVSSFTSSPEEVKPQPEYYTYERPELSPIYESVMNTQERKYNMNADGTEHRTFSKILNTEDSNMKKLESRSIDMEMSYSSPSYTQAFYNSGSYRHQYVSPFQTVSLLNNPEPYNVQNPVITYNTVTKSPSYPLSSISYNTKVTPGLSAYASPLISYAPPLFKSSENPSKTVTYSETPVSHVSFSGSGAVYSW